MRSWKSQCSRLAPDLAANASISCTSKRTRLNTKYEIGSDLHLNFQLIEPVGLLRSREACRFTFQSCFFRV